MISVTDLHGKELYVNAEMIESVQATPDTQILLSNGHRFYADAAPEDVVRSIIEYRRQCLLPTTPEDLILPSEG